MDGSAGHLLRLVRSGRARTRSDLRVQSGLSRTAVVTRVNRLVEAGLLLLGDGGDPGDPSDPGAAGTVGGGRAFGELTFNAGAGTVLAVAIGRSRSQVAVFDLAGTELGSSSVEHDAGAGPDDVLPRISARLEALVGRGDLAAPLAVGVSLPGTVDPVRAMIVDSPVMSGWDDVELAPFLAAVTTAPLVVGNDADVLAHSERVGHAAFDDLLVVKASTGLGLGVVAGGRVVTGHARGAGELGHTKVEAAAGRQCRCGDTGCLETLAGGWALVAAWRRRGGTVGHVRELVALALDGDADAQALLRASGHTLGEVLAVAVSLLNPQAVVIGGDMAAAYDLYAGAVRESVCARASAVAARDLVFLPARFGDRAGLVGCASLALDRALDDDAVEALVRERGQPGRWAGVPVDRTP